MTRQVWTIERRHNSYNRPDNVDYILYRSGVSIPLTKISRYDTSENRWEWHIIRDDKIMAKINNTKNRIVCSTEELEEIFPMYKDFEG